MFKIKCIILTVLMIVMFNVTTEANDVHSIYGLYKTVYSEDDKFLQSSRAEISLIEESENEYPQLYKALKDYNKMNYQRITKLNKKMYSEAVGFSKEYANHFNGFYYKHDIIVNRADSIAVSLIETEADYTGGVHGMYGWFGVNFDTATGQRLNIYDVCNNAEELTSAIVNRLYEDNGGMEFENLEERVLKMVVENTINWSLDYNGVTFYFNPYDIAPYAAGILTATITFNNYPNLFKSKYKQVPEMYCVYLPMGYSKTVSLNSNQKDFLHIYNEGDTCKIQYNEYENETKISDVTPILVHFPSGQNYIYLDGTNDFGMRNILIFDLNKKIQFVANENFTFQHSEKLNGNKKEQTFWIMTSPNAFKFDKSLTSNEKTSHFGGASEDGRIAFG